MRNAAEHLACIPETTIRNTRTVPIPTLSSLGQSGTLKPLAVRSFFHSDLGDLGIAQNLVVDAEIIHVAGIAEALVQEGSDKERAAGAEVVIEVSFLETLVRDETEGYASAIEVDPHRPLRLVDDESQVKPVAVENYSRLGLPLAACLAISDLQEDGAVGRVPSVDAELEAVGLLARHRVRE